MRLDAIKSSLKVSQSLAKYSCQGKTAENNFSHDVSARASAGACDGSLACSTCYVVMEQRIYDSLLPPSDQEEDLLGLAHSLELA